MARLRSARLRRRARVRRRAPRALSASAAGRGAPGPGTKRPTRACSARCRRSRAARRPGLDRQLGRRRAHRASCDEFLIEPVRALGLSATRVTACAIRDTRSRRARARRHRVRRLAAELSTCRRAFARHRVTVHVPRRPYVARAAGHSDDPRVRGAGLRHPAGLGAVGRRRGTCSRPGARFSRRARRRRDERAAARRLLGDASAARGARRARPRDDPSRATPARIASTSCCDRASSASRRSASRRARGRP